MPLLSVNWRGSLEVIQSNILSFSFVDVALFGQPLSLPPRPLDAVILFLEVVDVLVGGQVLPTR